MGRAVDADELKIHAFPMDNIGCDEVVLVEDIDEAPTIEPKQEWISVKESLPANDQKVLCSGYAGNVFVAMNLCENRLIFRKGYWRIWEDKSSRYKKFSHWMILPELPEREE